MIKTALFDIFNYYESKSTGNYENFRSAIRWIYSTDISPYSFNWVCSHLDCELTGKSIRKFFKELLTVLNNPTINHPLYERVRRVVSDN
jgi:hypothetical protein